MKDLTSIQPKVIELLDALIAENKAIPHRAAGFGKAADYNGENMSTQICAALMCRNPKTEAGYATNWKDLVTGWFYIALTAGMMNQDDDMAFLNKAMELCTNYASYRS